MEGVRLAEARGLLKFGRACGFDCYIVTDAANVNAQARRMDGHPFPATETLGERKAHTLAGSHAAHPIGLGEAAAYPAIALVEGGPDLLAACHYIHVEGCEAAVATVAMLGASHVIPAKALSAFAGKQVRLYPHLDASGAGATQRWGDQLTAVGAAVDVFSFSGFLRMDGEPVKDLNDLARISADSFHAAQAHLEGILP